MPAVQFDRAALVFLLPLLRDTNRAHLSELPAQDRAGLGELRLLRDKIIRRIAERCLDASAVQETLHSLW